MISKSSKEVIKGYATSKVAGSETNDCVVKAMASALDVSYDTAHALVAKDMNRVHRRGTKNAEIDKAMKRYFKEGLKVDGIEFEVKPCTDYQIKNYYKLYGEVVKRDKTVKSFIKSNPKGTYVVLVSKHAFTVKDGVLIDNAGEEFRPTRKVTKAFKFIGNDSRVGTQLNLF